MCLTRVLCVALAVAVVAYSFKSRLIWFLGTIGCFVGFLIPESNIGCTLYSDPVAAYLAGLSERANHVLFWGIAGAFAGICAGAAIAMWRRAHPPSKTDEPRNSSTPDPHKT